MALSSNKCRHMLLQSLIAWVWLGASSCSSENVKVEPPATSSGEKSKPSDAPDGNVDSDKGQMVLGTEAVSQKATGTNGGGNGNGQDLIAKERAAKSTCKFFTSTTDLNFSVKPPEFNDLLNSNINHFPPAVYPMPVNKTFTNGNWDKNAFKLVAAVDVKISYGVLWTPYNQRWKRVLPGEPEGDEFERRYFEVTIANADSASCTTTHVEQK